jgi:FeS assembly SUF system protein
MADLHDEPPAAPPPTAVTSLAASSAPPPSAETPAGRDAIQEGIVEVLKTVFDPEIPVNIYEMGLVYDIGIEPNGEVEIRMTLTSPACPVAGSLPAEVQTKIEQVPGVTATRIDLVWEPAWEPSRMSEAARLQLGMF